jgi:hypothetical protein
MANLPAKLVKLAVLADKCVRSLMNRGIDNDTAQDMVLVIMRESQDEISRGDTQGVTNALRLTFLK